jgi:hypothetical protein
VCIIGDSRAAQVNSDATTIQSLTASHWLNVANELNSGQLKLLGNYGISGNRSDQFLATNLSAALANSCELLIFNSPAVNDIAQAAVGNYNNVNGVAVTISNVAQVAASNITNAASAAVLVGKRVILVSEPGSTSFASIGPVGQVLQLNERLRDYAESMPGVSYWDITPYTWDTTVTASTTAIAFRAGCSADGTHYLSLCGYYQGVAFASWINSLIPPFESRQSSVIENNTNTAYQLLLNPLFTTLTGGTKGGAGTVTGNVPASWEIDADTGITATVTSQNSADGVGKSITLACVASGAGWVYLYQNISTALWSAGDIWQHSADVSVSAAASTNYFYMAPVINTSAGQPNVYVNWSNDTFLGPGATGYLLHMLSLPYQIPVGATKNYAQWSLRIRFTAAGSATITVSRPSARQRFTL